MSQARVEAGGAGVRLPPEVTRRLKAQVATLAEHVAARVQREIPAYAGPSDGRRHRLIVLAVTESAALFLRQLDGRRISTAGVDDLFRRMGYGEANDGHDLDSLDHALRTAGREAWRGLHTVIAGTGLPATVLGQLGDELATFMDHLSEQTRAGHTMAARVRERDVNVNRLALLHGLLHPESNAPIQVHSTLATWPLPARIMVVAASAPAGVTWPDTDGLDGQALVDPAGAPAIFLAPDSYGDQLVRRLQAVHPSISLAYSWSVPLQDAPHAHRWATRALALVTTGAIPRQPVIDCARYRTQLWLHAEPALRRQLAQELLKPLFAETPNSREILSETLLVWLETRESAPAIAAILGVHPQTVRYRWRRINELFGESLRDPEFVVQLTMVLKASVPLWIAGDQSDFERYWSEESK
jgi:hypothetical protein